jgi:hypothetical protein
LEKEEENNKKKNEMIVGIDHDIPMEDHEMGEDNEMDQSEESKIPVDKQPKKQQPAKRSSMMERE